MIDIPRSKALILACPRILSILNTVPSIDLRAGGKWPAGKDVQGSVRYHHVTFRYPSRPDVSVLADFNLDVQPKQTVALVGSSGAGKSTILSLLQRYYDVSEGAILVDGHDIRDLDPRWLQRFVSVVPQEPVLFSGSIRSNIG